MRHIIILTLILLRVEGCFRKEDSPREKDYCTYSVRVGNITESSATIIWRNTTCDCNLKLREFDFYIEFSLQLNVTNRNHTCNKFSIDFQRASSLTPVGHLNITKLCPNSWYALTFEPKKNKNVKVFTAILFFQTNEQSLGKQVKRNKITKMKQKLNQNEEN